MTPQEKLELQRIKAAIVDYLSSQPKPAKITSLHDAQGNRVMIENNQELIDIPVLFSTVTTNTNVS